MIVLIPPKFKIVWQLQLARDCIRGSWRRPIKKKILKEFPKVHSCSCMRHIIITLILADKTFDWLI